MTDKSQSRPPSPAGEQPLQDQVPGLEQGVTLQPTGVDLLNNQPGLSQCATTNQPDLINAGSQNQGDIAHPSEVNNTHLADSNSNDTLDAVSGMLQLSGGGDGGQNIQFIQDSDLANGQKALTPGKWVPPLVCHLRQTTSKQLEASKLSLCLWLLINTFQVIPNLCLWSLISVHRPILSPNNMQISICQWLCHNSSLRIQWVLLSPLPRMIFCTMRCILSSLSKPWSTSCHLLLCCHQEVTSTLLLWECLLLHQGHPQALSLCSTLMQLQQLRLLLILTMWPPPILLIPTIGGKISVL